MSSKREETKAFARLERELPGEDISLQCKYVSWYRKWRYCAVTITSPAKYTGDMDDLNECVEELIKMRKEDPITKEEQKQS